MAEFSLRGKITDDVVPANGLYALDVFLVKNQGHQILGNTTTDSNGDYSITVPGESTQNPFITAANLALNPAATEDLAGKTPTFWRRRWARGFVGEIEFHDDVVVPLPNPTDIPIGKCGENYLLKSPAKLISYDEQSGSWSGYFDPVVSLNSPNAIGAVGNDHFIVDSGNHRVLLYTDSSFSQLRTTIGGPSAGSGPLEFNNPSDLFSTNDRIFVSDSGNHRIQVYDSDWNFLYTWGGTQGTGLGELNEPVGICVGSSRIETGPFREIIESWLILEKGNSRITVINDSGVAIKTIGGLGSGPGQFNEPTKIIKDGVNSNGSTIVTDPNNNTFHVFDIEDVGSSNDYGISKSFQESALVGDITSLQQTNTGVIGTTPSQFFRFRNSGWEVSPETTISDYLATQNLNANPSLCGAASSGNRFYVCDQNNHVVIELDESLQVVNHFGGLGAGAGQLDTPCALVRTYIHLFVVERNNHRIQKFDLDGNALSTFGTQGNGPSQFSFPEDIIEGWDDFLIVADSGNNRLVLFDRSDDTFGGTLGTAGSGDGEFQNPTALAYYDSLAVLDAGNQRIVTFDSSFNPIGTLAGKVVDNINSPINLAASLTFLPSGSLLVSDGGAFDEFTLNFGDNGKFMAYLNICKDGQLIYSGKENLVELSVLRTVAQDVQLTLPSESYTLSGKLSTQDDSTPGGYWAKVYEVGVGSERWIGNLEAKTDTNGNFQLAFTSADLGNITNANPNVIVKIFDKNNLDVLVTSTLLTFATPALSIALFLPKPVGIDDSSGGGGDSGAVDLPTPSEFDVLQEKLGQFFTCKGFSNITPSDTLLLAQQTGLSANFIAVYMVAQQLQERVSGVPAEVFFGMLRTGFSLNMDTFLLSPRSAMKTAIKTAAEKRYFSGKYSEGQVLSFLDAIDTQRASAAFSDPSQPDGKSRLYQLFATSGLAESQLESFYQFYTASVDRTTLFTDIVSGVGPQGFLTQAEADRLELVVYLGGITQNHLELVRAIRNDANAPERLADLPVIARSQWESWVSATGLPTGADNISQTEYVDALLASIDQRFPTERIRGQVATGDWDSYFQNPQVLKNFLSGDPSFTLPGTDIPDFISNETSFSTTPAEAKDLIGDLQRLQRLLSLTSGKDLVKSVGELLAADVKNGSDLAWKGDAVKFDGVSSDDIIQFLQSQSSNLATASKSLMPQISGKFKHKILPNLIPQVDLTTPTRGGSAINDLAAQSATDDFCEYEDWEDALSPAAYMVDLLSYLSTLEDTQATANAYQQLTNRRPDIPSIALTKENTETLLPHIDLMIEILEEAVSGDAFTPQTTLAAKDLRVHPEHLNESAYGALKDATYPWGLPFHLWNSEARGYLSAMGLSRSAIMEAFPEAGSLHANHGVADYLKLAPKALAFLLGETSGGNLEDWYGLANTNYISSLPSVQALLDQTGLTFDALQQFLQSEALNPIGLAIYFPDSSDGYDLSLALLVAPNAPTVHTLPEAFLRRLLENKLLSASGLSDADREAWFGMVGSNPMSAALTTELTQVLKWQSIANCSFFEALMLAENALIRIPNAFASRFLNEARIPESDVRALFALNAGGTELANSSNDFYAGTNLDATVAYAMTQALGISPQDLDLTLQSGVLPSGNSLVTMANLTAIFHIVEVSKQLSMSVQEYLHWVKLGNLNPTANMLTTGMALVDSRSVYQQLPLSLADYLYVFFNGDQGSALKVTADEVATWLGEAQGSTNTLSAWLASKTDWSEATASYVLDHITPTASPTTATALLSSTTFAQQSATFTEADEAWQVMARLLKGIKAVQALGISESAGDYMAAIHTEGWAWYDVFNTSLGESPTADQYLQLQALANTLGKKDAWQGTNAEFIHTLKGIPSAANLDAVWDTLAAHTPWLKKDLQVLGAEYGYISPQDLTRTAARGWFSQLALHMKWIQKAKTTADELITWGNESLTTAETTPVKAAFKAAVGSEYTVRGTEVRDALRLQQRDALVQHFLHTNTNPAITDVDSLYGFYLIDNQTESCLLTSRLKQALLSVQQYIQRIGLGYETDFSLTQRSKAALAWRRYFRVWEANRKIFLYPENWLRPELRDDKTELFQTLEETLLQQEVNADTAEIAYRAYLKGLEKTARLDIAGLTEDPSGDVHLIARTQNLPVRYYYQRWRDKNEWMGWEQMQLDIQGEHVIPVHFNRRLVVFWPMFREVGDVNDSENSYNPNLQIQMQYSVLEEGQWGAMQLSKQALNAVKGTPGAWNTSQFMFRTFEQKSGLYIACYNGSGNVVGTFWLQNLGAPLHVSLPRDGQFNLGNLKITGAYRQNQKLQVDPAPSRPLEIGEEIAGLSDNARTQISQQFKNKTLLNNIPRGFSLTLTPQTKGNLPQYPFVLTDSERTYMVLPSEKAIDVSLTLTLEETVAPTLQVQTTHNNEEIQAFCDAVALEIERADRNDFQNADDLSIDQTFDRFGLGSGGFPVDDSADGDQPDSPEFEERKRKYEELCKNNLLVPDPVVIDPEPEVVLTPFTAAVKYKKYRFLELYHPYVGEMIEALERDGVSGLLDPEPSSPLYRQKHSTPGVFEAYEPNRDIIEGAYPQETYQFGQTSPYSKYNWEVFFHAPFLIASRLRENFQFEKAREWLHYIFDPTHFERGIDTPRTFWKVKPFFQYEDDFGVVGIVKQLREEPDRFAQQVESWEQNPFQPFAVARLRTVAFMKAVVMEYLETLLGWGDQLFQQDTRESLNEATQLYVLAAQILGPKPELVKTAGNGQQLNDQAMSVAAQEWARLETLFSGFQGKFKQTKAFKEEINAIHSLLYFGIPANDKLLGYWDTVADRLFKIRHCQNIDGQVRSLALFQAPINPALLAQGAAAGIDLGALLGTINSNLPPYRFEYMLNRAKEFAGELAGLGSAMLQAVEKRDNEAYSILRATQAKDLMDSLLASRQASLDEAQKSLDGLRQQRQVTENRKEYYLSREYTNFQEKKEQEKLAEARDLQGVAEVIRAISGGLHAIPQLNLGPVPSAEFGGQHLGPAIGAVADVFGIIAAHKTFVASTAAREAGYIRRQENWSFQAEQAELELKTLDEQIAGSEIRIAMATNDLQSHQLQISHAEEELSFLQTKFTNQALYGWMQSTLMGLYRSAYSLAYQTARQAETCYQFELPEHNTDEYIKPAYWQSRYQGLLSGEKLLHDLRLMERGYLDKNERKHEMVKHISLMQFDPVALINLKKTGSVEVSLPSILFNLDHPGQYMRCIKSVSISIPCVAGPYTNLSARLTLKSSKLNEQQGPGSYALLNREQPPVTAIATSTGQGDAGVFELNFRDERYLPFEGAGVEESVWELTLPQHFEQWDHDSISDVVFHIQYTALYDDNYTTTVTNDLKSQINAMMDDLQNSGQAMVKTLSLKQLFPDAYYALVNGDPADTSRIATISVEARHLPYFLTGATFIPQNKQLRVRLAKGATLSGSLAGVVNESSETADGTSNLTDLGDRDLGFTWTASQGPIGTWTLELATANFADLTEASVEDIYVLLDFIIQ